MEKPEEFEGTSGRFCELVSDEAKLQVEAPDQEEVSTSAFITKPVQQEGALSAIPQARGEVVSRKMKEYKKKADTREWESEEEEKEQRKPGEVPTLKFNLQVY